MPESPLRTLSVDFAVQIFNLVKMLKIRHETIVSNQIDRAGKSQGCAYQHLYPAGRKTALSLRKQSVFHDTRRSADGPHGKTAGQQTGQKTIRIA